MTGILVLVALVVGVVVAIAFAVYGKQSGRKPGRVRPEAPPSAEEERGAEGPNVEAPEVENEGARPRRR